MCRAMTAGGKRWLTQLNLTAMLNLEVRMPCRKPQDAIHCRHTLLWLRKHLRALAATTSVSRSDPITSVSLCCSIRGNNDCGICRLGPDKFCCRRRPGAGQLRSGQPSRGLHDSQGACRTAAPAWRLCRCTLAQPCRPSDLAECAWPQGFCQLMDRLCLASGLCGARHRHMCAAASCLYQTHMTTHPRLRGQPRQRLPSLEHRACHPSNSQLHSGKCAGQEGQQSTGGQLPSRSPLEEKPQADSTMGFGAKSDGEHLRQTCIVGIKASGDLL